MAKKRTKKLMRIRELAEASGISKDTIKYYIREGLIPRPIKTHPNMAYYNDAHLNALLAVKELKGKRFLPLSVIKEVLGGGKHELSIEETRTLTHMDGKLFQNLNEQPEIKPITLKMLAARTGASVKDIKELEKHRILHPIQKGKRTYYGEDDIRVTEAFVKLRKVGLTEELGIGVDVLEIHRDMVERLVVEEARLMAQHTTGKVSMEQLVNIVEETLTFTTILFDVLHKKSVLEVFKRVNEEFQESLKRGLLQESFSLERTGAKRKRPGQDK